MSGQRLRRFSIEESLRERLSVREIIRARIWQEVQEYNAQQKAAKFEGLILPTDEEQRLNVDKAGSFKPIDWERQYQTALRGFETNCFFILIGEQQASSLDEEFVMEAETEVSFVKLVPLVGG